MTQTKRTVTAVRVALPLNRRYNSSDSLTNFGQEREFSFQAAQNKAKLGAMGFILKDDYEAGIIAPYGIEQKYIKSGSSEAIVSTAIKTNEVLQNKLAERDAEIAKLRAELAGKGRGKKSAPVVTETEVTDEAE